MSKEDVRWVWLKIGLVTIGVAAAALVAARGLSEHLAFSAGPPPAIATAVESSQWPDCPPASAVRSFPAPPASVWLEAAAYRDALTQAVVERQWFSSTRMLHILATTIPPLSPAGDKPEWGFVCHHMPELDPSTLRSFRLRNIEPVPPRTWFMLPVRYRLVQAATASSPRAFSASASGRLIGLSRIGFSDDLLQALLYIEERHAEGYYLLLRRSGSSWRVIRKLTAWIT